MAGSSRPRMCRCTSWSRQLSRARFSNRRARSPAAGRPGRASLRQPQSSAGGERPRWRERCPRAGRLASRRASAVPPARAPVASAPSVERTSRTSIVARNTLPDCSLHQAQQPQPVPKLPRQQPRRRAELRLHPTDRRPRQPEARGRSEQRRSHVPAPPSERQPGARRRRISLCVDRPARRRASPGPASGVGAFERSVRGSTWQIESRRPMASRPAGEGPPWPRWSRPRRGGASACRVLAR